MQVRATVIAQPDQGLTRYLRTKKRTVVLLGAEMIGQMQSQMAHSARLGNVQGKRWKDLLDRPFYHHALEEGLRTALRQIGV